MEDKVESPHGPDEALVQVGVPVDALVCTPDVTETGESLRTVTDHTAGTVLGDGIQYKAIQGER